MSRVSLVMGSMGRSQEPLEFVESLARQSVPPRELIIVDQNEDDRLEPVEVRAKLLGITVKRIKEQQKNLSHARNIGIAQAVGDIIGFPDDDCWYEPDVIEQVEASFEADPTLHAITGSWSEAPPQNNVAGLIDIKELLNFRGPRTSSILLFVRCEALKALRGFDPRLGTGQWFGAAEEIDLVMRLGLSGKKLHYAPEITIHHPYNSVSNKPMKGNRLNTRLRSRGTGALYAKLSLKSYVVLRGCIAPVIRCILPPYRWEEKLALLNQAQGRIEGLFAWQHKYGCGKCSWDSHADAQIFEK